MVDDYLRYRVQESTLNVYLGHIENYIKPYIGNFALEKISIRDIKINWWDKIKALRKIDGDGNETDQPLLQAPLCRHRANRLPPH
jgi:hypothetical protein